MTNTKATHLIVGVGEVGIALKRILEKKVTLFWFDIKPKIKNNPPLSPEEIEVLHITFPQNEKFIRSVKQLIKKYNPKLTIIHSTTIPGTTKKLGANVVHSPIVGQHDCLYKHVKTFKKAVGPNSNKARLLAKKYIGKIFNLEFYKNSQTTEGAKVLALTKFAINVEMARYANLFCKNLKISYKETYTKFSELYNEGYKKNNLVIFIQPVLDPPKGKIGGSCVVPGVKKAQIILRSNFFDDIITKHEKEN